MNLKNYLLEYVSSGRGRKSTIVATDETIHQIVKDELDRLGHDADLNHIDVSEVTNMKHLFSSGERGLGPKYADLNPDISQWDVRKVENMYGMFLGCEKFNKDLSQWNVSKVENMNWMFYGCEKFNKDISGWNVRNVRKNSGIFYDCPIKEEYKPKFK